MVFKKLREKSLKGLDSTEAGFEDFSEMSPWKIIVSVLGYLPHTTTNVILFFILSALIGGASIAMAEWVRHLVDFLSEKDDGNIEKGVFSLQVGLVAGGIILAGGTRMTSEFLMSVLNSRSRTLVVRGMRTHAFSKLLRLPAPWLDKRTTGEIISTVGGQADAAVSGIFNYVVSTSRSGVIAVSMMGYMLYWDWLMTSVMIGSIPFLIVIYMVWSKPVRLLSRKAILTKQELTGVITESGSGYKLIKAFQAENWVSDKFRNTARRLASLEFKNAVVQALVPFTTQTATSAAIACMVLIAVMGISPLKTSEFLAFMTSAALLLAAFRELLQRQIGFVPALVAARKVFDMLEAPEEVLAGEDIENFQGHIAVKNLSFGYEGSNKLALKDVSLEVKPKTLNVILGANGSGKSTLVALLTKYYLPDSGTIEFDGKDIAGYHTGALRQLVPVAIQQAQIISGTVAENITFGLENVSRERIEEVARLAAAWDFIKEMKHGLDTKISPHGDLSGGQAQRVTLARILLRDSPVLILDEATSAIDYATDLEICKVLKKISKDRTVIAITHRPSIVSFADKVFVFEKAELAWQGKPSKVGDKDNPMASFFATIARQDDEDEQENLVLESFSDVEAMHLPAPSSYLEETILRGWYRDASWARLIAPLGWAVHMQSSLHRISYKHKWRHAIHLPVPVVVVGNITVGGTGKTPTVIALANHLKERGWSPGIVSRGYKGRGGWYPMYATPHARAWEVGDEAVLLARHSSCPVVVDMDRVRAAASLLNDHNCDIIISDDGLQHYRLARDIEILNVDSQRGFGNGRCLPAGPLRESVSRLHDIDFIVTKDGTMANLPQAFFCHAIRAG